MGKKGSPMRNLELLIPLAVMALFAAIRHWVLPQINLGPLQPLFAPLEIAAFAVAVHAYARYPAWLMWLYALLPAATLLWKDTFNFVTIAIAMVK